MLATNDKRLALSAYERILDMIMSNQIKPGTLVQERRLAEHLNMSRTPVRDALLMLEGEGLLVRQESRGLQVKYLNLEDFIENLSIRKLLEPEAARTAAGRIPPEKLRDWTRRLEGLLALVNDGGAVPDRAEVRSIDDDLHTSISAAAGNKQMAAIILSLRRQTQAFDLRSIPERLEDTCREHLAVVQALAEGRGEEAAKAMRIHLDGVRNSIIARLAGT